MRFLVAWFLATLTTKAATADEFSGAIQFYRDVNYRYLLALFEFNKANRCFNMACGSYNDVVSSATWSGLPSTATYDGASKAKVVFYVNTDCTGTSKGFSTTAGGVQTFAEAGINDAISSFMVLQSSMEVENGLTSICSTRSRLLGEDGNATVNDSS